MFTSGINRPILIGYTVVDRAEMRKQLGVAIAALTQLRDGLSTQPTDLLVLYQTENCYNSPKKLLARSPNHTITRLCDLARAPKPSFLASGRPAHQIIFST